jgi:glycosyltransferase involved in cell wall biosynthesis
MSKYRTEEVLVSVVMVTFNHEKFIAQAIESVLTQKTMFRFELVIGEDCSNDNTLNIIKDYVRKQPNIIKDKSNSINLGIAANVLRTVQECDGKYIAFCEGDDYWTDPFKLQNQVDFLETNPDYGMVATDIVPVDEDSTPLYGIESIESVRNRYISGSVFWKLLKGNFINTLTVCVRRELVMDIIRRAEKNNRWYIYDYWVWLHLACRTKIMIFNEQTAAYRIHFGSISHKKNFFQQRIHLVRADALQYYLQCHSYNELSRIEKAKIAK